MSEDQFDEDKDAPPVGPKAFEGELPRKGRFARGLTLRAVIPNAITAAALCSGLTGVRFAIEAVGPNGEHGDWEMAAYAVLLAGVLDGIDGRIARLLKAQSRFGAELDSLADSISFGVAPALILFLWTLQDLPRFGWIAGLAFALCCALRLARFNAQIDVDEQPHKSAGYLTGVPAPMGAALGALPMFLWLASGNEMFREPVVVAIWLALIGFLMISNIATLSWSLIRPRRSWRLGFIAFVGILFALLLIEPWWTLVAIFGGYLALTPYSISSYAKIRRLRAARASTPQP